MTLESLRADSVFRRKHIHLVNSDEVLQTDATQIISRQREESRATAVDIAKLCAKASLLRFGGEGGHTPIPAQ